MILRLQRFCQPSMMVIDALVEWRSVSTALFQRRGGRFMYTMSMALLMRSRRDVWRSLGLMEWQ